MPVITLTSDLGLKDYYSGAVKGALLQLCPGTQLVDLSHQIQANNLQQAAFVLRNAWEQFPEGTIHWIGVSSSKRGNVRKLIAHHKNHWFVGRDEGTFSLVFDGYPERLFAIDDGTGHLPSCPHSVLVWAAGHLAAQGDVSDIATEVRHMESLNLLQPQSGPDHIKGAIEYIDVFGNLTVNISRLQFEEAAAGRSFELHFRGDERITKICTRYSEVPEGEKLCRINAGGNLEIAINQGNAAALLGLRTEDPVQINFS